LLAWVREDDINHGAGFRRPAEGAADVVRVALLDDGTTGAFFLAAGRDDDEPTNV
jgi:hypothetical protein